jgi:hypothetical protein
MPVGSCLVTAHVVTNGRNELEGGPAVVNAVPDYWCQPPVSYQARQVENPKRRRSSQCEKLNEYDFADYDPFLRVLTL